MKLKGISKIEQHVEKIVLGVFALFALAMLVLQFLTPNTVQIPGQGAKAPDKAVSSVASLAQQVNNALSADTVPELPQLPPLQDQFRSMVTRERRAEALALATPFGGELTGGGSELVIRPDGDRRYVEIVPPAPTGVVAATYEGTVDPIEREQIAELAALLPPQQPYDLRHVSVEASFDAASMLKSALEGDGEAEGLPQAWVQGRMELLLVELVRQEQSENGTWGPETVIGAAPGRFSLHDKVTAKDLPPRELTAILEAERANRPQIRRPAPYSFISGRDWLPPARAAAATGLDPNRDRANDLAGQVARIDAEIARIGQQLSQPPGGGRPGERPPPGGGPPPPGGPPGPGPKPGEDRGQRGASSTGAPSPWPDIPSDWRAQGGGTPPRPQPGGGGPDQTRRDREQRNRETLQKRLETLKKDRDDIVKRLTEMGYDDKGVPLSTTGQPAPPEAAGEGMGSLADPTTTMVGVWAHDLTAKPGSTYRYAVRVWVTNPLFGNAGQLVEAQRALAGQPAIASGLSEWSQPIRVEPSVVTFFTGARESGAIGGAGGRANAVVTGEMYEFFYGWWRRAEVSLDPGDRLAAQLELPELPLFTVGTGSNGEPAVTERGVLPERKRTMAEQAFVLGIARVAGGPAAGMFEVFLRDAAGRVQVRTPESEQASELLARLRQSSEAAARATVREPGQPVSGGGTPPPGGRQPGPFPGGPIPGGPVPGEIPVPAPAGDRE